MHFEANLIISTYHLKNTLGRKHSSLEHISHVRIPNSDFRGLSVESDKQFFRPKLIARIESGFQFPDV